MVRKHVLALSLLFQGLSKCLVDMDIRDVAVLEDDAEEAKLGVQILDHLSRHVTLEVEDLTQPNAIHKVSNALVDLSVEKLVETGSTQSVDKVFDFHWASWHAEGEVKVNTDVSIILCGAVVDLSELVIRI